MRIYNRYIISLCLLLLLTTVVLSAYGQSHLDVYYTVYLMESLALTFLYSYLNPRARRGLNIVGYVLSAGFMLIVAMKVPEMLFRL